MSTVSTVEASGARSSFPRRRRRSALTLAVDDDIDPGAVDGTQVYERSKYVAGQVSALVARYVRIRGDLLVEFASLQDDDAAGRRAALVCKGILVSARTELESRKPSLIVVANLLGLAERMLVSLYRPEILRLRLQTFKRELLGLDPQPTAQIAAIRSAAVDMDKAGEDHRDVIETVVKDAITYVNGCEERRLIEDDLQVSRLSRVLWYVTWAWLLLLAAIPIVSSVQATDTDVIWPVLVVGRGDIVDLLAGALGLSVVGAVGGVVSGMLNVRDSHATMLDYRTSLKKLTLKPIIGAVAALVVYLFLSAQVIAGVEITSPGTYVVLSFLAGFSERYFLSVINAQEQRLDAASRAAAQVSETHPDA